MADHVYEKHEKCEKPGCPICEGGLMICTVCGGIEGSLPSECVGRKMTGVERDQVYHGIIDYRDGHWVSRRSFHAPTGVIKHDHE